MHLPLGQTDKRSATAAVRAGAASSDAKNRKMLIRGEAADVRSGKVAPAQGRKRRPRSRNAERDRRALSPVSRPTAPAIAQSERERL